MDLVKRLLVPAIVLGFVVAAAVSVLGGDTAKLLIITAWVRLTGGTVNRTVVSRQGAATPRSVRWAGPGTVIALSPR